MSVEISANGKSPAHQMTISMRYIDISTHALGKASRHRLGKDVPFHSVQIPLGCQTISLEVVHLNMCITNDSLVKRQKHHRYRSASSMLSVEDCPALESTESCYQAEALNGIHCSALMHDSCCNAIERKPSDGEYAQDDQADELAFAAPLKSLADLPPFMLSPSRSHCNTILPIGGKIMYPRKRSRTYIESHPPQASLVDITDLVQLLASGLREAVSESPRRRVDGVQPDDKNSLLRLSNIAPALFSPGYLSNISSRAVFIPLLSHALLSVGFKHAYSSSLRSKFTQLLHVDSNMTATAQHEDPEQETIASKLFDLVRRGLFNPKASRRLQPITAVPPNSICSSDFSLETSILGPIQTSPFQSSQDSNLLDNEFDDLYGMDDSDILPILGEQDDGPWNARRCVSMSQESMDSGFSDDGHEQDDLLSVSDGHACNMDSYSTGERAAQQARSSSVFEPLDLEGDQQGRWITPTDDADDGDMLL
nr:hypothetical protein CFP56_43832 [Quercus suber]